MFPLCQIIFNASKIVLPSPEIVMQKPKQNRLRMPIKVDEKNIYKVRDKVYLETKNL